LLKTNIIKETRRHLFIYNVIFFSQKEKKGQTILTLSHL
jgi:hypothetical protein